MEYFLQLAAYGLLLSAVLFLSLRLYHIKRQIKLISGQLEPLEYHMVSVGLSDREIVGMTVKINNLIERMQQIKADAGKRNLL